MESSRLRKASACSSCRQIWQTGTERKDFVLQSLGATNPVERREVKIPILSQKARQGWGTLAIINQQSALRFQSHVTDAADKVVGGCLAIFHDNDFDGRGLIVGAQD